MKKLIVMTALAFVSSFSFAEEVPTDEAYTNALQIVRAYNKAHKKSGGAKIAKNEVKGERDYAKRLGVSDKALQEMKRRLQVLNATTNRPIEGVIETRVAKSGVREKWAAAEFDAAFTRDVRKAAKKSEKNLQKILKTIEQAKKKAADEDEVRFYDMLEELIYSK